MPKKGRFGKYGWQFVSEKKDIKLHATEDSLDIKRILKPEAEERE